MRVTMLLADHAQAAEGKLNLIGAGWTITSGLPNPIPFAIGIIIMVPWDQSNMQHRFDLDLLDSDGQRVADPEGTPIHLDGQFEVGRPPGAPHGIALEQIFALNFGPIPLPPGQRWQWRCSINGEPAASCEFTTRPAG